MVNNYDKIADNYDFLSRLVYGKAQVEAQVNQLKNVPANSRILVVGGGTGWILDEISKIYPSGLTIIYVELSAKMIEKSKTRSVGYNFIEFINLGIEDFKADKSFDVILTPFLFDNFDAKRAGAVFSQLDNVLNKQGSWFMVDFSLNNNRGRWWKWMLLKLMYVFFKTIGIVEANKLIDMSPYFLNAGYQICDEQFYFGNFIKACIYKK
ncbi:class I SAM-dependent methyltransferase [Pedobacter aquatilis]|uniref:class I SAM-dependent methyltransferase n=1 Tax=Pedobacter aquatilis TaxID=351343 RepID=UPI00292D404E|nr:class I SAM-dependent methyltransferase [Pedobacter aquatilis]